MPRTPSTVCDKKIIPMVPSLFIILSGSGVLVSGFCMEDEAWSVCDGSLEIQHPPLTTLLSRNIYKMFSLVKNLSLKKVSNVQVPTGKTE